MTTRTLGTNGTTTLTAIFAAGGRGNNSNIGEQNDANFANFSQTDFATVQESIKGTNTNAHGRADYALTKSGLLFIPGNRGVLRLQPGDWVGVDAVGWPILVSAYSIANSGGWTHS